MGNGIEDKQPSIGNIFYDTGERSSVCLEYKVFEDTDLSIILMDSLGRTRMQKHFLLSPEKSDIEIQLPDLKPGSYNAWIEVNGQTCIRSIEIEKNQSSRSNWLKKLMGLFN